MPENSKWIGKEIPSGFWYLVMANREGTARDRGLDGIDKLYAFVPLASANMYVIVGIPEQIAFAEANKAIIYDVSYLILVFAAFMIFIWKGGQWAIVRPLHGLASTARRLSHGDFTARTDLVYAGDIGQLARSFDAMAGSLETEHKKLYAIIDELPAAIWVQSSDLVTRFANRRFIDTFGDPVGKKCFEFFNNCSLSCDNCENIFRTQKSGNFALTFADGKTLEVYQRLFRDMDGSPLVLKMGVDVTEKRKAEEEMIRLDRLNLVGEMAATIAHEIRNPMTTVRGFLQMLGAKEGCHRYADYFHIMIEELDRANAIITEYLSLTRKAKVPMGSCNLNELINHIQPLIVSDATGLGSTIDIDLGDIPNLSVNKKEIEQLLLNLVRNGLEAMPAGGVVTIRTFCEGDRVVLEVRDQGGGIDPAVVAKLGTPFVTTKEKGTGLGLSVCFAIADKHDARISVDTGPNGTTFRVTFATPGDTEV